jgi:hypothetical protein
MAPSPTWRWPLAAGNSKPPAFYLAPGGQIAVEPTTQGRLLLLVNGKVNASFLSPRLFLEASAGMGMLLEPGEQCQLVSGTGCVILSLEADHLEVDPCGISHPARVMGQQWPNFESN